MAKLQQNLENEQREIRKCDFVLADVHIQHSTLAAAVQYIEETYHYLKASRTAGFTDSLNHIDRKRHLLFLVFQGKPTLEQAVQLTGLQAVKTPGKAIHSYL
ncbi:unnamed protein product [Calypogeia fissa]